MGTPNILPTLDSPNGASKSMHRVSRAEDRFSWRKMVTRNVPLGELRGVTNNENVLTSSTVLHFIVDCADLQKIISLMFVIY
jgi:hypothetical protein